MASFTERVTILIETKVSSAKSELAGLRKSIAETEGATGKLKVAAGGMGKAVNSAVSALASPAGIAAAGAAITGVAVKSVKAFEQLGLTVGKFSDATGIATEDASRLVEVVSDLGIAPDEAASSIGRMSKAIGANSDAFAQYGINAVKAKDGTVDVLATFENAINVISKISDPTRQAAAANAVFGRSWQSMAELIKGGLPALQSAMAAVQSSKVQTGDDVAQARALRDAFDQLGDAANGMLLTVGKALAPAIADMATKIADVTAKAEPMAKAFGDAVSQMVGDLGPLIDGLVAVGEEISKIGASDIAPGVGVKISDAWSAFLDALPAVGDLRHYDQLVDAVGGGTVQLTGQISDLAFAQGNATARTTDAAAAAAELAKKQKQANEAFAASGQALTEWADRTVKAFEDAQTAFVDLADAQGQIDDMSSTFAGMERAASAMQSAFDLGNAPVDTLGRIQDIDGAIRDLGQFIKDNKGVVPNIFNPNDIQAGPFLAKIDSLRGPIQQAVTDAFATGGPVAAQATADSYVKQIVSSLHGKLTPGDVQSLLGLTDLQATIKVAVDEKSKQEALDLLETITGLTGQTPWTATVKLAVDGGTLSADAAKVLEAQRLTALGIDVPATLLDIPEKDKVAAKAEADRWAAVHPVDMQASIDAPDVRAVLLARDGGQAEADKLPPISFKSIVNTPRFGPYDAGGRVDGAGGIAGERGPEILNRRYLTEGPTYVPPGTRVTSRRRTAVILRTRGARGLRRYDGGGTVGGATSLNVTFNGVGAIGNRYDLMRTMRRAEHDMNRLLGTRRT